MPWEKVATMKTYKAVFERDGGMWLVRIHGLRGCHTQARTIEQGLERIREALGLFVDGAEEAPIQVRLPHDIDRAVARLTRLRREAEEAQEAAQEAQAETAKELTNDLGLRDVSHLLGISHQRVHQLVKH